MIQRSGKPFVFLWAMLALSLPSLGQIQPGRLPSGPPPQPGQLGPAPKSSDKAIDKCCSRLTANYRRCRRRQRTGHRSRDGADGSCAHDRARP